MWKGIRLVCLFVILVSLTACNQGKENSLIYLTMASTQSSNNRQVYKSESSQMILEENEKQKMPILITNGKKFHVLANVTPTLEALIEELPPKFIMNNLNENEKDYKLSQPIPATNKNIQKIEAGDVMLFGQQTLVIFYQSFSTSYHYTQIGSIENKESLLDTLLGSETAEVQVVKK